MFVGETGVDRIVRRSTELAKQDPNADVRKQGGIDFATLQKYLNYWYAISLDLFGGEISSNAADFFGASLKGRFKESQHEEHTALGQHYDMDVIEDGKVVRKEIPLRTAMNEVLRDGYVEDCQRAVNKWNRTIQDAGLTGIELKLPHRRFNRNQGIYAGLHFDVEGNPLSADEFKRRQDEWLPSEADRTYIHSLMQPVVERGKIVNWLAPPARGINGQPFDFEYVRK